MFFIYGSSRLCRDIYDDTVTMQLWVVSAPAGEVFITIRHAQLGPVTFDVVSAARGATGPVEL